VSLVTKKHACDFLWYRDPGANNASDVKFGQFIGTFTED
jgi:hypothetical protein